MKSKKISEYFNDDNKIKAFDFIIEEYFKQGFSSMSKSEIDLLIFSAINQFSNIKDKTDYSLSKKLKITQTRIRNFKVKEALKYSPIDINYVKKYLIEKAKYARIEENNKKISLPIYDPNVYIELENIIEQENGYVEAQLNPKIFTIRIDQLINLLISFKKNENNSDIKKIEKEFLEAIKKEINSENKFSEKIDISNIYSLKDFKKEILNKSIDLGLELLFSSVPGGSFAKKFINNLINKYAT